VVVLFDGRVDEWSWFVSRWWKDIVAIYDGMGTSWFNNCVVRKVGNGENASFWRDMWVGNAPLFTSFPRLFSVFLQKYAKVGYFSGVNEKIGDWFFVVKTTFRVGIEFA
jgi:hypothetical protein